MVQSHIDTVNCNNILQFSSTFYPKGDSEGSSSEVLVKFFDSPLLHISLLIKDFQISTCSLALPVEPFPGVYTAQSEALNKNITK